MLGTGVTYCQGELYNMESLEYALTDVDKIIFCESPPQKDELDYQMKFDQFVQDTLQEKEKGSSNDKNDNGSSSGSGSSETTTASSEDPKELEIQQLSELIEMKAKIAEQVDCIGMKNVLRAYQNVRYADYGTSQAAKRSLFKFQSREEDFGLFSIHFDDEEDDNIYEEATVSASDDYSNIGDQRSKRSKRDNDYNERYDTMMMNSNNYGLEQNKYDQSSYYDDDYSNDEYNYDNYGMDDAYGNSDTKQTKSTAVKPISTIKTQVNWLKNKFNHGVFVGKLPSSQLQQGGSEASIISSRLRSRDDPERGIDLSNGFAGFVCRLCSDGKTYEAFVRTSDFESHGIEYVCKFQSSGKANIGNKSRNKFTTVRLPFSSFVPVARRKRGIDSKTIGDQFKSFNGNDVKQIGFRVCSTDNVMSISSIESRIKGKKSNDNNWISFYLALSYIKLFRMQPEPEFIYLSDARLGDVDKGMVNHQLKQVILPNKENVRNDGATTLFDEAEVKRVITNRKDRSAQELYYKYVGEELLRNSGLTYSIVRIPELNELASGEFSTLRLKQVRLNQIVILLFDASKDQDERNQRYLRVNFYFIITNQ